MRRDIQVPESHYRSADIDFDDHYRKIISEHCGNEGVSEDDEAAADVEDADHDEEERHLDEPGVGTIYDSVCIKCLQRSKFSGKVPYKSLPVLS